LKRTHEILEFGHGSKMLKPSPTIHPSAMPPDPGHPFA
jgi:hypothetical protein